MAFARILAQARLPAAVQANRGLGFRNPTLKLAVFAFNEGDKKKVTGIFEGYNNVDVIVPEAGANIDFKAFNSVLNGCLPSLAPAK